MQVLTYYYLWSTPYDRGDDLFRIGWRYLEEVFSFFFSALWIGGNNVMKNDAEMGCVAA